MFNNETLDFTGLRRDKLIRVYPSRKPLRHIPPMVADDQPSRFVPLEEHFENFSETLYDVGSNMFNMFDDAENFGLFKAIRKRFEARGLIKDKKKLAKADVIQAKADAMRIQANAEAAKLQAEGQAAIEAARAQAAQTNQLASQVNPSYANTQPEQTPMYQTFPDQMTAGLQPGGAEDTTEQDNSRVRMSPTKQQPAAPAKKNNKIMFVVIAVVVIVAGYLYFKNKKK